MNVFEISLESAIPQNFQGFEIDLRSAPPKISEKVVDLQKHLPQNKRVKSLQYNGANLKEGVLNIYSCRFDSGHCSVYFFGNLQGTVMNSEKNFADCNERAYDLLHSRLKFIVNKSKNILKSYYRDAKIKNIEHHIIAFLTDN